MGRTVRQLICILMIAVMSLPGLLFVLKQLILLEHKERMEEELKTAQSILIKVKTSSISYLFWEKEIKIDGRLFDLVSLEIKDGIAHCRGIFDEKEQKIESELNRLLEKKGANENNRNLAKRWLSFLLNYKIHHSEIPQPPLPITSPLKASYLLIFSSIIIPGHYPPPEC